VVSRADLAEVFFRQTLRPAASASRGSGATARFSLEAAERKPAAPPRPASRRDETASARSEAGRADRAQDARAQDARVEDARAENARAEDAKSRAARTDRAANARSETSQESRAQAAPARSKPLPAGAARPGTEAAAARTPGAAKSAAEGPERPAGDGTEPAQKAAAEEEAAKEAGAAMASEKDARETKEPDSGSPDTAAVADPSALLSPHVPMPAPTAAGVAIAGQGGPGEGEAVEAAGSAAAGHAAPTAATAAATGDAPVSAAAGAAGFEAALAGMQEAAASAAPPPAGPAAALPPPGSGAPQGLHAAEAASQAASQAAGTVAAAPPPATPPIPLGAVPMTIGLRSLSGMNRFAIRLDPVELGRIDVSLDLDKEGGKARAHLVVDRPETLALLQRDASALQQALAQAGFDVGAEAGGGIDLSLRSETGSQQGNRDGESASRGRSDTGPGGRDDIAAPLDRLPLRHLRAVSGLDIRI